MFVWFWYQSDTVSYNTSMGEMKGKTENAKDFPVVEKQCRAYNEMVDITRSLWDFLLFSKDGTNKLFPEFNMKDVAVCDFQVINPLNL